MDEVVIARRYARAVFRTGADPGVAREVWEALVEFADVYARNEKVRMVLESPAITSDAKQNILAQSLPKGPARDLARLLLEKGRLSLITLIADELTRLRLEAEGILAGDLTTAVPPAEDWVSSLTTLLERLTGKNVAITTRVDPSVVGGVKLTLGDVVIDGTLAGRLRVMREKLASPVT